MRVRGTCMQSGTGLWVPDTTASAQHVILFQSGRQKMYVFAIHRQSGYMWRFVCFGGFFLRRFFRIILPGGITAQEIPQIGSGWSWSLRVATYAILSSIRPCKIPYREAISHLSLVLKDFSGRWKYKNRFIEPSTCDLPVISSRNWCIDLNR